MKTLIVASQNLHKIREISQLLSGTGFLVKGVKDFDGLKMPPETGKTFLENARIKAFAVRDFLSKQSDRQNQTYILADDSGIECEDLDGQPGIYSARFAGENATDDENNLKLLESLRQIENPTLKAQYVCALVLVLPNQNAKEIEDTCQGEIRFQAKGENGFGYDPYFYLPEFQQHIAELEPQIKNKISHRGKALQQLLQFLTSSNQTTSES